MSKSDPTCASLASHFAYEISKKNHDEMRQISKQSNVWSKGSLRQVDKEE